jgi:hypothetical protein
MYEFTQLFLYKFQFLAEIFIAESLFVVHLKRRDHFILRLILSLIGSFGLTFAIPIVSYGFLYQTAMFLLIFIFSIISVLVCFEESFINTVFCCMAGYSVQHIAFSVYQFFMIATLFDGGTSLDMYGSGAATTGFAKFLSFYIYIVFYLITYIASYLLLGRKIKKEQDFYITNNSLLFVAALTVLLAVFLNSVMINTCDAKEDQIQLLVSFAYGILSCAIVLALQFKLKEAKETEKELSIVEQLWKEDKAHYELAKESIDIINIKCHDLKHQIAAIRNGGKLDNDALKDVENSVMVYGSIIKTGNDALDVVLTEKSLLCSKNNISLTYIADGENISFMSASSIYSLFGNAIDNAIEYLVKEDVDKRFIRLHIKAIKEMVSIHIENYFDGMIKFEGGLPVTTKKDTNFHGYGTLSMKKLVESYDGDFFINTSDHLYCIDILLPIPASEVKEVPKP